MEKSLKSISTINPAITENTVCSIYRFKSAWVCHLIVLCFVSLLAFQTCWVTFQAKNDVRSAPASSALTLVSHRSHNVSTANRHLRSTLSG